METPMLDKDEFLLCQEAAKNGKRIVEEEIQKRNIQNYEWLGEVSKVQERFRYFIDMYRVITGFPETNSNAIWHHTIDQYGEDCPSCKKPLRTQKARYCAACGFGKDDFTSPDTKPLVERRPGLFK